MATILRMPSTAVSSTASPSHCSKLQQDLDLMRPHSVILLRFSGSRITPCFPEPNSNHHLSVLGQRTKYFLRTFALMTVTPDTSTCRKMSAVISLRIITGRDHPYRTISVYQLVIRVSDRTSHCKNATNMSKKREQLSQANAGQKFKELANSQLHSFQPPLSDNKSLLRERRG